MAEESEPPHTWIWLGLAIVATVFAVGWCTREDARLRDVPRPANGSPTPAHATAPRPVSGWKTIPITDDLTGTVGKIVCVTSDNVVELGWPYKPLTADLCVRDTPRQGRSVMLTLSDDAIISCHGCQISLRFDDGDIRTFTADRPRSNASDVLFIENVARFERAIARSTTARVEIPFHETGNSVFTFRTAGYPPP